MTAHHAPRFLILRLLTLGLSVVISLASCNKIRDRGIDDGKGSSPQESNPEAVFPHSQVFKRTSLHGKTFHQSASDCKSCHGPALDGGSSGVSCMQCHAFIEHTPEFKTQTHGEAYLKDPKSCLGCHASMNRNEDREHKSLSPACTQCHTYPHEAGWAQPKKHGHAFLEKKDCAQCHGESSKFKEKYPDKFLSCDGCHVMMPHGENFTGDHASVASEYTGNCTACHSDLMKNMPNFEGTGCYTCHAEGDVPRVKWVPKEQHARRNEFKKPTERPKERKIATKKTKPSKSTPTPSTTN